MARSMESAIHRVTRREAQSVVTYTHPPVIKANATPAVDSHGLVSNGTRRPYHTRRAPTSKTNAKQIGLRTESQNGSVKSKSQNATPRRLRGVHESASRRG